MGKGRFKIDFTMLVVNSDRIRAPGKWIISPTNVESFAHACGCIGARLCRSKMDRVGRFIKDCHDRMHAIASDSAPQKW